MNLQFHKHFEKKYKKLHLKEQKKAQARLELFLEHPHHPILENHPLKGKYLGYRSINITSDLRAVYKQLTGDQCIFVAIDTHSNLYK